ncbi:MAG: efflux RND transporter permease subunit [Bacteroidota bacterium]
MDQLFQRLRPFIRMLIRRAGLVLGIAVAASAMGLFFASNLTVDTDFSKLIPSDYPSVQALERLREEVGGESSVDVVIESPSFEANRQFAEDLIPRALALTGNGRGEEYLTRVDYTRDTEFLENNALYFATDAELDSLEEFLHTKIEEARLEANPFFFDIEDDFDDEEAGTDDQAIESFDEAYRNIVGTEYPISDDSTTMVVRFYPSDSQTNLTFISDLYADLDELVASMAPASYHSQMEVDLGGRLLRQLIEVQAITDDVLSSFGAGVLAVLLVVVFYFSFKAYRARVGRHFDRRVFATKFARAPVMAALIGIPLLMSLSWTFGVAYLAFSTLNLMTSTLGLVLFGLGIDYGIHFYARYSEERARGRGLSDAIETTFVSTGQAITVGAMTTAAALLVLVFADFKGFSEFGFIAGTGILFALLAMTVVLPALLVVFERARLLNFGASLDVAGAQLDRSGRFPFARGLLFGSIGLIVASIVFLPRVQFEYEFGQLEPEYEAYNQVHAKIGQVYPGGKRNPAYIIVDEPEEAQRVKSALLEHARRDTLTPTIGDVETLQDRFPLSDSRKQLRVERVAEVRNLLDEPILRAEATADIERLRKAAQTRSPLTIDDVPESLKNRFLSKSGEIGHFVMVYPSVGLSDGRNSMAFAEDVGRIVTENGEVYHAGSTSLVAADMLRLMMAEAPWMVLATFVVVVLLMWVNFGSIRWAALAVLPLIVGVLWMLLVMELFGLKLNFYNLVVLPAVLGIGNDAGVHLVHRYREEGRGSIMAVLRSTGEHVTVGSLTTMIGFAGLLLSFHPGLRSIGELAVVGIGSTLLAAIIFLPSLLQSREDRITTASASEPTEDKTTAARRESRSEMMQFESVKN